MTPNPLEKLIDCLADSLESAKDSTKHCNIVTCFSPKELDLAARALEKKALGKSSKVIALENQNKYLYPGFTYFRPLSGYLGVKKDMAKPIVDFRDWDDAMSKNSSFIDPARMMIRCRSFIDELISALDRLISDNNQQLTVIVKNPLLSDAHVFNTLFHLIKSLGKHEIIANFQLWILIDHRKESNFSNLFIEQTEVFAQRASFKFSYPQVPTLKKLLESFSIDSHQIVDTLTKIKLGIGRKPYFSVDELNTTLEENQCGISFPFRTPATTKFVEHEVNLTNLIEICHDGSYTEARRLLLESKKDLSLAELYLKTSLSRLIGKGKSNIGESRVEDLLHDSSYISLYTYLMKTKDADPKFVEIYQQKIKSSPPNSHRTIYTLCQAMIFRTFTDRNENLYQCMVSTIDCIPSSHRDSFEFRVYQTIITGMKHILTYAQQEESEQKRLDKVRNKINILVQDQSKDDFEVIAKKYPDLLTVLPYVYYYIGDNRKYENFDQAIDKLDLAHLKNLTYHAGIDQKVIILANMAPSYFDRADFSSALEYLDKAKQIVKYLPDKKDNVHLARFYGDALLLGGISDPNIFPLQEEGLKISHSKIDDFVLKRGLWCHKIIHGIKDENSIEIYKDLMQQMKKQNINLRSPIPYACIAYIDFLKTHPKASKKEKIELLEFLSGCDSATRKLSQEILEAISESVNGNGTSKLSENLLSASTIYQNTPLDLISTYVVSRILPQIEGSETRDKIIIENFKTVSKSFITKWRGFRKRKDFLSSHMNRDILSNANERTSLDWDDSSKLFLDHRKDITTKEEFGLCLGFLFFLTSHFPKISISLHTEDSDTYCKVKFTNKRGNTKGIFIEHAESKWESPKTSDLFLAKKINGWFVYHSKHSHKFEVHAPNNEVIISIKSSKSMRKAEDKFLDRISSTNFFIEILEVLANIGLRNQVKQLKEKRIKIMEETKESHRIMVKETAQSTSEAYLHTKNLSSMINSSQYGILIFDEELNISEGSIQDISKLFDIESNESFEDLTNILFGEKHTVISILRAILGEDIIAFDTNALQLPSVIFLGKKQFEFDWIPIVDSNDIVKHITLVVKPDKKLKNANLSYLQDSFEMQCFVSVFDHSSDQIINMKNSLSDFIKDYSKYFSKKTEPELLRTIHTLKGNCRTFGLTDLAKNFHKLEDLLAQGDHVCQPEFINDIEKKIGMYKSIVENNTIEQPSL